MEIREIQSLATAGGFGLRSTPDDRAMNCDCPSCQCAASRRDCRNTQISGFLSPSCFYKEGRFAIVTNVGSGMRWTRCVIRRMTYRGRRNRVVLAPRRWRQVGDDASHHADDGGKKARSPGRSRISRKTIAQGRPVAPAEPVVLPRAFCCTRTMGASRRPAFPAPSRCDEGVRSKNSDATRRENAPPWSTTLPLRRPCESRDL